VDEKLSRSLLEMEQLIVSEFDSGKLETEGDARILHQML